MSYHAPIFNLSSEINTIPDPVNQRDLARYQDDLPTVLDAIADLNASTLIDFWADASLQLNQIDQNSNLFSWLLDWYGRQELGYQPALNNLKTHVRDCYLTKTHLYYVCGLGYDTLDTDLVGGNGDGRTSKAILTWLNGQTNPQIEAIRQRWLLKGVHANE